MAATVGAVTVATEHHNWQKHTPYPDPRFSKLSPNLVALGDELGKRFGMTNLGGFQVRAIRGGTAPSSHAFGSANDRRYFELGRARAVAEVLPWLIDNSEEFHVQQIHDYLGCRIWKAGRTFDVADAHGSWWTPQNPSTANGMGQSWAVYFHIETNLSGWNDSTPIPNRLDLSAPSPAPIPQPIPQPIPLPGGPFVHATIRTGSVNADVFAAQVILRHRAGQRNVIADGKFGTVTDRAVREVQIFFGLYVDGVVGPKTWAVLDLLANQ